MDENLDLRRQAPSIEASFEYTGKETQEVTPSIEK
jgi:hypothetical protein